LAGSAQIGLRNTLRGKSGLERIEGAGKLSELIVIYELAVGHQQTGPSPDPLVAQCELSGGLNSAAESVRGRTARAVTRGKIARILLENSGRPDRVRPFKQALAPFTLE